MQSGRAACPSQAAVPHGTAHMPDDGATSGWPSQQGDANAEEAARRSADALAVSPAAPRDDMGESELQRATSSPPPPTFVNERNGARSTERKSRWSPGGRSSGGQLKHDPWQTWRVLAASRNGSHKGLPNIARSAAALSGAP